MDLGKSISQKPLSNITNTAAFRSEQKPNRDLDFTNEVIQNIKKNYHDRIQSLEFGIREAYGLIDNDELIQTMKLSHVSDEYRKQRILEILEDTLSNEKEAMIEKLNDTNAYLLAEVKKFDDENTKIKKLYEEEVGKFHKTMAEIEVILENESKTKNQYKQEYEVLVLKLAQITQIHEETLAHKEDQLKHTTQTLTTDIYTLKQYIEDCKIKQADCEVIIEEKSRLVEEMHKDMEILKQEYSHIEYNHKNLINEHNKLRNNYLQIEEAKLKGDKGLDEARVIIKKLEEEIKNLGSSLEVAQREKAEFVNKTEFIQNQVKKIVEQEQKASADIVEETKKKYKGRLGEAKKKIAEVNEANEALASEITRLKNQANENKLMHERAISQMQNDMKMIKTEWEKKCQEIDLGSQRNLAEQKAKHQMQINQLQSEYQALLDKKLLEIQSEANVEITRTKASDMEIKAQLETKIAQIEKDYILKTKHDNILTTEILAVKTKHAQEIKELEDHFERQQTLKLSQWTEKNKLESETTITNLKNQKQNLEQEIHKLRSDLQRVVDNKLEEKDKISQLVTELEESEANRKELVNRLDEASNNLIKLKTIYEDELRKGKKHENDAYELNRKIQDLSRQIEEQGNIISSLRKELASHAEDRGRGEEKVTEATHKNRLLQNEVESSKTDIRNLERDKEDLNRKIRELREEVQQEAQRGREAIANIRKEENVKLETEMNERIKLQNKISQTENKIRSLQAELGDRDSTIGELKNTTAKLESFIGEIQNKSFKLETDLIQKDGQVRDMEKKLDRAQAKYQDTKFAMKRAISHKLETFREEIRSLRQSFTLELESSKRSVNGVYHEIVNYCGEKIEFERLKSFEEREKTLKSVVRDYEDKLKDFESSKDSIKSRLSHSEEMVKDQETLRLENKDLKRKVIALEKENDSFRLMSSKKAEEFETLQELVNKEMKRVKDESKKILDDSIRQTDEYYQKEIRGLLRTIDDLKDSNVNRIRRLEEEIATLSKNHVNDLTQVKNFYNLKIENYDKELNLIESEYKNKKKEKQILKIELERLKENYAQVREENQRAYVAFEERLENFKQSIQHDGEKYIMQKSQTNAEVERYRKENQELRQDISILRAKIEELQMQREQLRAELEKYRVLANEKEKEVVKVAKGREKEIEELQMLLSKSINSFSGAMDNNMRIAAKLDKETEELAKNFKSGSKSGDFGGSRNFSDFLKNK